MSLHMKKKTLPAMILTGALAAGAPMVAMSESDSKISLTAGHNVVDAVDDLRETTADLVGAMRQVETQFGTDWQANSAQLASMEQNLQQMEDTLDRKAENTDSSWLNWFEDRDYSVTVKDQLVTLGQDLNSMARMLDKAKSNSDTQIIVGHNLVDQVDDVRETVGDLLQAIGNAGPEWGWFDDAERFSSELAALDQMEKTLDTKAEMTDSEWETFIGSPDYPVVVRDQIDELASIVSSFANSITTESRVSRN